MNRRFAVQLKFSLIITFIFSENLKVGRGRGHTSGASEKNFVVPLYFFGSRSTISRFDERFCDGQYSLVSFLFAVPLLTVPPVPSHL